MKRATCFARAARGWIWVALLGFGLGVHGGSAYASGGSFTVTNTNDSGAGSLRQAILDSNATAGGTNTITFAIATGAQSIRPLSGLPQITQPVLIDGWSQPGFSGTPLIEVNGDQVSSYARGLYVTGGGCTVRGLVINRWSGEGVILAGSGGNTLQGNYIGTDSSGTTAAPNGWVGVATYCPDNRIGGAAAGAGNVISGNSWDGIDLWDGSDRTVIQGNLVGTDVTGTVALGNAHIGIYSTGCSYLQFGGTTPGAGNVVSGNSLFGIDSGSTGSVFEGNRIGTDITGALPLGNAAEGMFLADCVNCRLGGTTPEAANVISGNGGWGVQLFGNPSGCLVVGNRIGTNRNGTAAIPNVHGIVVMGSGNRVGGTTAAERNVVSGNLFYGVTLAGSGNQVQGCYIGTDANGSSALGNHGPGVFLVGSNHVVGGTQSGAGNVISGNGDSGVYLGDGATGMLVQGNVIGVNASGTAAIGNALDGVHVNGSTDGPAVANVIGGTQAGAGNRISGNGANGVTVAVNAARISILGNRISSNGGLGIDLSAFAWPDGVTANHSGGAAAGGNGLQNYPVLTSAFTSGSNTVVAGSLSGAANTTYRIEYFSNTVADPSGYGEGEQCLGSVSVTTDGGGIAVFSATLPGTAATHSVAATATDPDGNTSEFSAVVRDGGADTIPPSAGGAVVGTDGSGRTIAQVTVRDTGSGLGSIRVVSASNCTLSWPAFTPGSTAPLTVTATKTNQSQRSSFTFVVTDLAGNATTVDPVVATLEIGAGGTVVTRTFHGIPRSERYLSVSNGSPGLTRLTVSVNGKTLPALDLSDGRQRSLDLGPALHAGRNRVTLVGRGPSGGAATVLISDTATTVPAPTRGRNFEWGD